MKLKDHTYLFVLLGINLIVLLTFFLPMQQLPGPIFGGDAYFHHGHVIHLYDGGSITASSHDPLSMESYPWFYSVVVGETARALGIDVYTADITLFPIIMLLISFLVWYALLLTIFKHKHVALIGAEAVFITQFTYQFNASVFSNFIMLPLTALVILDYIHSKQRWKAAMVAVTVGIAGLSNLHTFAFAVGFLVLMTVWDARKKPSWNFIGLTAVALVVGVLIAMLYLRVPLFVYHGQTLNNWQQYTVPDLTIGLTISNLYWSLGANVIIKILAAIGVVLFLLSKKKEPALPIVLLIGFLGTIHPFLTQPLMHTDFGYYKYPGIMELAFLLFAVLAMYYAYTEVAKFIKPEYLLVLGCIVIITGLLVFVRIPSVKADRWAQVGYNTQGAQFPRDIYTAAKATTSVNDVFIGEHGESLFALNGASGRKVIFMRRTHFTPFVDVDKRVADAAVILYGNNTLLRKQLLQYYHINYYYADFYAFQSKDQCLKGWDAFANPANGDAAYACLLTTVQYEQYLHDNGIETQRVLTRKDVSRNSAGRFELVAVKPGDVQFNLTPLNADYNTKGFIIARINA